jgi:hypothetical protein
VKEAAIDSAKDHGKERMEEMQYASFAQRYIGMLISQGMYDQSTNMSSH